MNEITPRSGSLKTNTQFDYILLDGSGSMASKWLDTCAAIDNYVDVLRKNNVNTTLRLHIFDSTDIEYRAQENPIEQWQPATSFGFHGGGTPLYDAINVMGRAMKDLDPPRAHILIATDGQETSSKTTRVQAKAILDWCRAKGWQVTFMGCDWNNSEQAKSLGCSEQACIGVQQKLLGDAARNLAEKRTRYGLYGENMHFTDNEKQQFGGYLASPSGSAESRDRAAAEADMERSS